MAVYRRGRRWRAVVELPRKEGEKRRQKTAVFALKREAEAWEAKAKVEFGQGYVDAGRTTVGGYLDTWLETAGIGWKRSTRALYAQAAGRWKPLIGDIPLGKLTPIEVQRAVNALAGQVGPRTVRDYFGPLRRAVRQAVEWGSLGRDVTRGIRLPRDPRREMLCWDEPEARRFLAASAGDRYAALYRLALASGLRVGELLGLRWSDVDWRDGAIRVRRSLSWPLGQEPRLEEPKTPAARRTVPLDPGTLEALRSHRTRQAAERARGGPDRPDLGLVFATRSGGYVEPRSLWKLFRRAVRRAGVRAVRLHDLRHTHATILLRQGRGIREVADRLGHANPALTLRVYAHVLPDQRAEAARAIGAALDGGPGAPDRDPM